MKIQNNINIYRGNNTYPLNNRKPSFTSRGETELMGINSYWAENELEQFEEAINKHPAAKKFFEKYDGNFYMQLDIDPLDWFQGFNGEDYTYGVMGVKYKDPLHPNEQHIRSFINAAGRNSSEFVNDVIEKMLGYGEDDILKKVHDKHSPGDTNYNDQLTIWLNCFDVEHQGEIEEAKKREEEIAAIEKARAARKAARKEAIKKAWRNFIYWLQKLTDNN